MNQNPYEVLADWLESEAREVREIEQKANKVLQEDGDEPAYRELMKSKALKLAELAEKSKKYSGVLDESGKGAIIERIGQFSNSASTAMNIGSVFFMSALLYPEEYQEGQKNDLENFAEYVRSLG